MAFLYCVHFSINLFTLTPRPENTSANRNYATRTSQVVYNAWNDHCQEAASVLLELSENRHLYVSVGMRDGTPVIALPYENDDGHRRYKLGTIRLLPSNQ